MAAPAAPLAVDAWGSDAGRDREQALENTLALSGLLGARAEKPRRDRPSAPSSRVEAELEPADAQEGQEVSRLLGMDAMHHVGRDARCNPSRYLEISDVHGAGKSDNTLAYQHVTLSLSQTSSHVP